MRLSGFFVIFLVEAVKSARYIKWLCSALNPFSTFITSVFQKFESAIRKAIPRSGRLRHRERESPLLADTCQNISTLADWSLNQVFTPNFP